MHAHAFVYEFNTGRSAKANSIQRVIKEHVQSQMDPWVNEPDGLNGARMASVLHATVTELSLAATSICTRMRSFINSILEGQLKPTQSNA